MRYKTAKEVLSTEMVQVMFVYKEWLSKNIISAGVSWNGTSLVKKKLITCIWSQKMCYTQGR
jgi:hypothetical protein